MSAAALLNGEQKPVITPDGSLQYTFPLEEEEELDIADGIEDAKVWAVKIPKFLLERWERVQEAGVELGTLMIDNAAATPTVTLRLPPPEVPQIDSLGSSSKRKYDTSGIPEEYEIYMPPEGPRNTYIFSEKERTWGRLFGPNGKKKKTQKAEPQLVAKVNHECSARPIVSTEYNKILAQRRLEAEQSKRPIVQINNTIMNQGKLNQLASGFSNATSSFGKTMGNGPKRPPPGERHARLERSELLDRLFQLFSQSPYWGIPALKATLLQPDAWLREVLKDIAEVIKEGDHIHMWQLKSNFREQPGQNEEIGTPEEEDDDDDEGDDDDFEEVLAL
ncbi:transcription initiation factor TFIIF subunit beta, partial [Tremellales sp. Uapishka_1]